MKRSFRNTSNDQPHLRHWLIITLVVLALIVTLFAWNSAAEAETLQVFLSKDKPVATAGVGLVARTPLWM